MHVRHFVDYKRMINQDVKQV